MDRKPIVGSGGKPWYTSAYRRAVIDMHIRYYRPLRLAVPLSPTVKRRARVSKGTTLSSSQSWCSAFTCESSISKYVP